MASRYVFGGAAWIVGMACVGAAWAQAPATAPAGAGPRFEISPTEFNFGTAWQGQPLKQEFTIKNTGDAPLTLEVKSSCGCTVPTKPKSPLAPGASDTMTITYDSLRRLGPANQTVTLTCNDPARGSTVVKITGEVKPIYELEPKDGMIFGQLYQQSQESKAVEVVNKYTDKLFLKLKEGQDFGPFAVEIQEVEPGQRYKLTARTRPPLKVDRYQANVVLTTGIELVPEISVPMYGFVQPPVSVRPAKLYLPRNAVSPMTRVLRVSHAPDYPCEIKSAQASHDAIKVSFGQAAPGADGKSAGVFEVTVVLPPGDRIPAGVEPRIEIKTTAADAEYQTLSVPIQIIAPPPATTQPQAAPVAPPQPG